MAAHALDPAPGDGFDVVRHLDKLHAQRVDRSASLFASAAVF